ncbi:MAG: hypothetical protein MAG795_01179 [Candidatus Woesearchaeota archaeon]|nr:hypothetical protein [Candidatus Woesearchaeota archaeon]
MRKSEKTFIIINIVCLLFAAAVIINGLVQKPVYTNPGTYNQLSFDPDSPVKTKQFDSVQDYQDFISNSGGQSSSYYGARTLGVAQDSAGMMVESAAKIESAPSAGGSDYSETNVQVENVDEGDVIKTDGEYIYTISDNTLFIVKAYPGQEAEVVFSEKLDNKPTGMFIKGNKLAVFGQFNNIEYFKKIDFRPKYGMTYLNIYDTTDKSDPELVKEFKFEGSYFNSRMIQDDMYLIVRTRPYYRDAFPTPLMIEGERKIGMPVSDIHYYNIPYNNPQLVTVYSVDIDDNEAVDSAAVAVEYGQNMYMSENNIFITYTERINEYEIQQEIVMDLMQDKLTDADKQVVEKIKATDNQVLSQREKQQKIMQIYESYVYYLDQEEQDELQDKAELMLKNKLEKYKHLEFTVINKIEADNGQVKVGSNGKVPGQIINQFSMDENDNVFRIATTINSRWSRFDKQRTQSTNNVYALNQNLDIIGELEGLAPGERIYSTRFMHDRLYMVTFKQVDPFFVIDLSNPRDIEQLGKLKIPGFSRYLHPYDEDTIIGIGQEATETGRTTGLKISLFDVSDVENPEEIAKFVTEERYARSTALYEHKAFLFSKEKELLVIPAYSYNYKDSEGYNGAFVFDITKDNIELRGLIDHSQGSGRHYRPSVERSLYIEELLYTKSPTLLRINQLEDLSSVKSVKLEQESDIKVY